MTEELKPLHTPGVLTAADEVIKVDAHEQQWNAVLLGPEGKTPELSADDAKALWDGAMAAKAARETAMPTEADALGQFFAAVTRLGDFGWRHPMYMHGAGECDMIEQGSSGVHRGFYSGDWPDGHWFYRDEIDIAEPFMVKKVETAAKLDTNP